MSVKAQCFRVLTTAPTDLKQINATRLFYEKPNVGFCQCSVIRCVFEKQVPNMQY